MTGYTKSSGPCLAQLGLVSCILAASCESSVADLGFSFRDSDFREHISQVAVTVAEPFSNTESLTGATEFIGCEKLGFFRPTTLFDRNEKQLSECHLMVLRCVCMCMTQADYPS